MLSGIKYYNIILVVFQSAFLYYSFRSKILNIDNKNVVVTRLAESGVTRLAESGVTSRSYQLFPCHDKCWDGNNCQTSICQHCPFACSSNTCNFRSTSCDYRCIYKSDCTLNQCQNCLFCDDNESISLSCPIMTTFEDKTDMVLSESSSSTSSKFFYSWKHSGRPYFHEGSPLFVDINGDSILDYFNSMHGHPIENDIGSRMELAISEVSTQNSVYSFTQVSDRIIIDDFDDDNIYYIDSHGELMADLDGDGYLDILISNGGSVGYIQGGDEQLYDNILLWGEPKLNPLTNEMYTIFKGGRKASREANVHMRLGRGRFIYVLDVNNDGLPDLFSAQDRLVTNNIAPGILLINQGNRKWKEDYSMMEYTRAMIVTDADGDGFANEILITRSFCYPRRDGPNTDQNYPHLGSFTHNMERFCSDRPVGTFAIYLYNQDRMQMEEVSKPFVNFGSSKDMQSSCCQHGLWDGSNDCTINSVSTGDFDNDQIADHVVLYQSKLQFYFSSERQNKLLTGDPNYIGLEIKLPNYCSTGLSVRVVDFDNDGKEEIFVVCENPGTFLVYSRGLAMTDWTLEKSCHESMGDINNRFRVIATHDDIIEFCQQYGQSRKWKTATTLCDEYKRKKDIPSAKTSGVSVYDLNNDGFLDIVSTHTFGYMKIFYNKPLKDNRYIMFDLRGEKKIFKNGVGLTFILWCRNDDGEIVKQFRERVSYNHPIDMSGVQEDRIIFGLGMDQYPIKLIIRYPDKRRKEMILETWEFSQSIMNINEFVSSSENIIPEQGSNVNVDDIVYLIDSGSTYKKQCTVILLGVFLCFIFLFTS